ncbi:DnaJ-domain-containing protein [Desarmillaria tabescens]|uniref:DnaJ-domain-containing protein n=1 Tax=Armillaria tabescens TaxID=1929756 RepID=A0AA39N674_ARMTA|nr:DnaJ-domain-containing protein [Desarmillaria tabescens]KAK0459377.1 DnaJ-domain-containing protein [Desarmillaria tabescens]
MAYSIILGMIGWSVLPDFATTHILRFIHGQLKNPPSPRTPLYVQHYRYTFAFVVLAYLLYNLIQGSSSVPPNFYQILGVPHDVDDNGLKLAFRQFTKRYHPDKPGIGPEGAEMFMRVRDAFEALKNPVVRFAYDRFGPDVLLWQQLSTPREYLRQGLVQSSGFHIVSGLVLVFYSSIGRESPVKFVCVPVTMEGLDLTSGQWRFILYAAFLFSEIALLVSPSPSATQSNSTILHSFFPQRVAFQHVLFLHQLFFSLSVAVSRVAPRLFPEPPDQTVVELEKLHALAGMADREASMLLHTELHSVHPVTSSSEKVSLSRMRPLLEPSSDVMDELSKEMENMIIETNIKKDAGPLKTIWETAVQKGRDSVLDTVEPKWETSSKNLPSPRPSPPPRNTRNSYIRARSVSY